MDIEIAPLGTDRDGNAGWIRTSIDGEPSGEVVYSGSCIPCLPTVSWALFANLEDANDWVWAHIADTGHAALVAHALWRPVASVTV